MKAVLLSVKPKWCEMFASGKKTIEVRKTAPKLETPFKAYMYCTKAGYMYRCRFDENHLAIPEVWNGKVVGEFICERVTEHEICDSGAVVNYWAEGLQHSCLTVSQIDEYVGKRSSSDYGKKSKVYGLHISDLKIYDKPRELGEFGIARAPMSWCYVEQAP
jgi:predicted transcriptional regulator|nr:MAG TPA: helix-turn-helix domain-containing protein [Caudoviricetes sp.]